MKPRSLSRSVTLGAFALVACTSLLFVACSSSSSSSSTFKRNNIVVSNVISSESPASTSIAAVYFTIENTSATIDKLFSVSVPQDLAKSASLHETVKGEGAAGMMSMSAVSSVAIPANGTVTFEPGGYHVMLEGLVAPLKNGQTFDLNLGFLNGGVIKVTAKVKAS